MASSIMISDFVLYTHGCFRLLTVLSIMLLDCAFIIMIIISIIRLKCLISKCLSYILLKIDELALVFPFLSGRQDFSFIYHRVCAFIVSSVPNSAHMLYFNIILVSITVFTLYNLRLRIIIYLCL